MFTWQKLGNIFAPDHTHPWMISHAANPCPIVINDSIVRVYLTSRDAQNRSHIGYVDLDGLNNFKVIRISETPLVTPGLPGYFDDSGAAMGCYLAHAGKQYLYYLGWNLKVTVPWQNSIGLAVADMGSEKFTKYSNAPIVDRSNEDPFSISYPSVIFDTGKFKMWYGSNLTWGPTQEKMNHVIKYAESYDGINWNRTNHVCINLATEAEYAISKPCVLKINDAFCMWYSYRGSAISPDYRIGFAASDNGVDWNRMDNLAGIDVSPEGWDSQMICYPGVFLFRGKYFMLYNGNGFGKTGFGLAVKK